MAEKKFVYIIKCGQFFKVGITSNIRKRVSSIKSANPFPIVLIGSRYSVNAKSLEKELHKELKQHLVHGEWYKPPIIKIHNMMALYNFKEHESLKSEEMLSPYLEGQKDLVKVIREVLSGFA